MTVVSALSVVVVVAEEGESVGKFKETSNREGLAPPPIRFDRKPLILKDIHCCSFNYPAVGNLVLTTDVAESAVVPCVQ